jgi:hypothetical protein
MKQIMAGLDKEQRLRAAAVLEALQWMTDVPDQTALAAPLCACLRALNTAAAAAHQQARDTTDEEEGDERPEPSSGCAACGL